MDPRKDKAQILDRISRYFGSGDPQNAENWIKRLNDDRLRTLHQTISDEIKVSVEKIKLLTGSKALQDSKDAQEYINLVKAEKLIAEEMNERGLAISKEIKEEKKLTPHEMMNSKASPIDLIFQKIEEPAFSEWFAQYARNMTEKDFTALQRIHTDNLFNSEDKTLHQDKISRLTFPLKQAATERRLIKQHAEDFIELYNLGIRYEYDLKHKGSTVSYDIAAKNLPIIIEQLSAIPSFIFGSDYGRALLIKPDEMLANLKKWREQYPPIFNPEKFLKELEEAKDGYNPAEIKAWASDIVVKFDASQLEDLRLAVLKKNKDKKTTAPLANAVLLKEINNEQGRRYQDAQEKIVDKLQNITALTEAIRESFFWQTGRKKQYRKVINASLEEIRSFMSDTKGPYHEEIKQFVQKQFSTIKIGKNQMDLASHLRKIYKKELDYHASGLLPDEVKAEPKRSLFKRK